MDLQSQVGRKIVMTRDLKIGDLLRLEELDPLQLVTRKLESWESISADPPTFRLEEGLQPGQVRLRRVYPSPV
jgi:hypothetical protein